MTITLGYEGVLYYSATPLTGRPADSPTVDFTSATWVEIDNVTDVDSAFDSESQDTTTRAQAKLGWASEIKTTKQATLTFSMLWSPGDTGFDAIRGAFLANSQLALLDLDGPLPDSVDAWADATSYSVGDYVTNDSNTYRVIVAHTSATTTIEPPNTTYYKQIQSQGIVGNWSITFGQKKPVKGVVTVDVQAVASEYSNWVKVTDATGALAAV